MKCPENCQCGRHRYPGFPCPPGCVCWKHYKSYDHRKKISEGVRRAHQ